MNNGELFEAGAASADTAQRIVPQANRYRWEQQWLQENRRISGVVHNDERSFELVASASPLVNQTTVQDGAESTVIVAQPAAVPQPGRAALAELAYASLQTNIKNAAAPAPIFSDMAAPRRDTLYKAAQPQPESSTAALARNKSDPQQFALWRSDDEIKISMRLSQPEQEQAATLGTLRQWLKDMGLKLTSLIVNGNVQWQAKQSARDDQ